MSNLQAKFASALLVGVAAGAILISLPRHAAHAADSCLLEPKDDTPQGKHWYYRIERGTGRHCWYLRGEDEKSARADTPAAAPAEKPTPRRADAPASRAIADAHAEITPRNSGADDAPATAVAPSVWPNPSQASPVAADAAPTATSPAASAGASPQSPLAARWPQPSDAAPTPAASQQPDASLMMADAQTDDATNDAAAQPVPPPPVLADAPAERNTGSIQKLVVVAFGALALAGLTGSAVYRLGRRRKRNDWQRERTNWQSPDNPHEPPWAEPRRSRPGSAAAVRSLDDLDLDQPSPAMQPPEPARFESDEPVDRVEKIEEFLARLTRQLQAELEGVRPALNEEPHAGTT